MVKLFAPGTRERFVDLVCAGATLDAAAKAVGASDGSATRWWRQSGGMELAVAGVGGLLDPAPDDVPSGRMLSLADRRVIEFGLRQAMSYSRIAAGLGRNKSVVWREVKRNGSPDGVYRARVAHTRAHQARRRPKPFKLRENPVLCRRIETWMDQGWSPKLIATVLAKTPGIDQTGRVSHETIYQALYVQTRGHLRADLNQKLSLKRRHRVTRGSGRKDNSPYKNAFKISERPPEVADRAVPGHWEGDLIVGPAGKSAIGTLVERSTRFTILLHLPDRHDASSVADAMVSQMRKLPEHLRRSITWDRGTELAEYERIQLALETKVFFCDPHSPWQRGTNENTNRLLRFWFEKGTDLSVHTAADLQRVQDTLNARPRPTLNLQTPAIRLNALLKTAA